ncbi:MAG: hypothetical protein ACXACU_12225 [Candidatus Hodarchaeales archaeon]|jgi:hypothetical protein
MYTEYVSIHKGDLPQKRNQQSGFRNEPVMNENKNRQKTIEASEKQLTILADRALLLLSFKDTPTQNLRHVLKILGIQTLEEKQHVLKIIFRLIQEGTVYVPRGIGTLIDKGYRFDKDSPEEIEGINLCLLKPYDQLIKELQREIQELQERTPR